MSSIIWDTINPNTTSGTDLSVVLNDFKNAVVSGFSGTVRPVNLQAGGYWIDITLAPSNYWSFKLYNGTSDVELFKINIVTAKILLADAEASFSIIKTSDDTVGAALNLLKKRVTGGGQTLDGDDIANIKFYGHDSAGTSFQQAAIKAVSENNVDTTHKGSYLAFFVAQVDGSSIFEAVRIANDGNTGFGVTAPDAKVHAMSTGTAIKGENISDSVNAAICVLRKQRIAGSGQVVNGDLVGNYSFVSTDNSGAAIEVAGLVTAANETHTSANNGVSVTIKYKNKLTNVFHNAVVFSDGTMTINDDVVMVGNLTVQGTTTSVATTNTEIKDKNIVINKSGTDATGEGAGLTVERTGTDGSIIYADAEETKFKVGALGSEVGLVDKSTVQNVSNKKIITPGRLDPKKDTYANLSTYATTAVNGELCFATDYKKAYQVIDGALVELGAGGGSGGYNYNDNDFNTNITGVSTTSGTNLAITPETASPLLGAGSLKITKNSTANSTQYVTLKQFTLQSAHEYSVFEVELGIKEIATYTDGDASIEVWDGTATFAVTPAEIYTSLAGTVHYKGTFQTGAAGTVYDVRVRCNNTNAWTLVLDGFSGSSWYIGPQRGGSSGAVDVYLGGATLTPVNFSVSSSSAYAWRSGDRVRISGFAVLNAAPTGAIRLQFQQYVKDDSKVTNDSPVGNATGYDASVPTSFNGSILASTGAANSFIILGDSSNSWSSVLPITWASGDYIYFNLEYPVLGWSSNMVLSEDAGNREIAAEMHTTTTSITSAGGDTTVIYTTATRDTTAAYNSTTGIYTIPESGVYDIDARAYFTAVTVSTGITFRLGLKKNTGVIIYLDDYVIPAALNGTSFAVGLQGGYSKYFIKGDTVSITAFQNQTTAIALQGGTRNYFSIAKRSNPQTIAASGVLECTYQSNSGAALSSTGATYVYEDKVSDSHGAYNPSTGIYVVPFSGKYTVKASLMPVSRTWAVGDSIELVLLLNGTAVARKLIKAQVIYTGYMQGELSTEYPVNKGDQLKISVSVSGAPNAYSAEALYNMLSISRIGGI